MEEIQEVIRQMEPEQALASLGGILKDLLTRAGEDARLDFVVNLIGEAGADKVASLVHLWLAECMGEGVDPTKMCQGLVDKVTRSKQLRSVTDPEILILFEDWLEELEEEVVTFLRQHPHSQAADMAKQLGLSQRGATFLLAKQQRETRNNNREE